ncbi:MAG: antibiotic biosynthesis monooxygenase [Actinomycetota bacterium]|nr:antibiotic biosynthesis monooxygenase [Actinomycetota bacterium]
MFVIIAKAECRPDKRTEMIKVLQAVAAESRQEAGCRSYRFLADIDDDNAFASIEEWESRQAIDEHFATAHVATMMAALPDLLASQPVIEVHEIAATTGPPAG